MVLPHLFGNHLLCNLVVVFFGSRPRTNPYKYKYERRVHRGNKKPKNDEWSIKVGGLPWRPVQRAYETPRTTVNMCSNESLHENPSVYPLPSSLSFVWINRNRTTAPPHRDFVSGVWPSTIVFFFPLIQGFSSFFPLEESVFGLSFIGTFSSSSWCDEGFSSTVLTPSLLSSLRGI